MKTITLHQPWASLVALGVKTIIDTSWPAPASLIGQPLAIHAGAKAPREDDVIGDWTVNELSFRGGQWAMREGDLRVWHYLDLGAVVATCRLGACAPIGGPYSFHTGTFEGDEGDFPDQPVVVRHPAMFSSPEYLCIDCPKRGHVDITDQLPYGDFRPGRWAWMLEDVKPTTERCPKCWGRGTIDFPGLDGPVFVCPCCDENGHCPPVPARGRQRIWEWTP